MFTPTHCLGQRLRNTVTSFSAVFHASLSAAGVGQWSGKHFGGLCIFNEAQVNSIRFVLFGFAEKQYD